MSKPSFPASYAAMTANGHFFHDRFGVYPNARAGHVWLYSNTPYPGMPPGFRVRETAETAHALHQAGYRVIGSTFFPWTGPHAGRTYVILVEAPPADVERLAGLYTEAREANWRHGMAHDDGRPILPPWLRVETITISAAVELMGQRDAFDRLTPKTGEATAVITWGEYASACGLDLPRDAKPTARHSHDRAADVEAVVDSHLELVLDSLPEEGSVKFEWMTIDPEGTVQLAYTLYDAEDCLLYFRDEYTSVRDSIDGVDEFALTPLPESSFSA